MSGGGVVSMVNVSLVVCLSSSFSGLFDGTGLLDGVRGLVEGLARRVSPYAAVLAVSVPASMVACNQTLGIMLTSQLCGHAEAGTRFGFDGGEGARSAEAAENSSGAHA